MLSIRNLSKTYANGVHALRGVSLEIPNGLFGLLGPNGAGKSTLMRTIATLQEPDSGSIRLGEIDVLADKTAARRRLGYLPQEFGVYPKVSAEAMLDHFAVLKGVVDRRERKPLVEALLRQVNLWEVRRQKLGTFSGGMRQRFGIAQALIGDPRLVIVDEPTAGLDPEERNRFLNLLAEIGENVAVILSTHIVEDVTDLCPTMAIMNKGQVLLTGRPADAIAALETARFDPRPKGDRKPAAVGQGDEADIGRQAGQGAGLVRDLRSRRKHAANAVLAGRAAAHQVEQVMAALGLEQLAAVDPPKQLDHGLGRGRVPNVPQVALGAEQVGDVAVQVARRPFAGSQQRPHLRERQELARLRALRHRAPGRPLWPRRGRAVAGAQTAPR